MQKFKYAIVLSFIIAAIVTPTPDMVTQTVPGGPDDRALPARRGGGVPVREEVRLALDFEIRRDRRQRVVEDQHGVVDGKEHGVVALLHFRCTTS